MPMPTGSFQKKQGSRCPRGVTKVETAGPTGWPPWSGLGLGNHTLVHLAGCACMGAAVEGWSSHCTNLPGIRNMAWCLSQMWFLSHQIGNVKWHCLLCRMSHPWAPEYLLCLSLGNAFLDCCIVFVSIMMHACSLTVSLALDSFLLRWHSLFMYIPSWSTHCPIPVILALPAPFEPSPGFKTLLLYCWTLSVQHFSWTPHVQAAQSQVGAPSPQPGCAELCSLML